MRTRFIPPLAPPMRPSPVLGAIGVRPGPTTVEPAIWVIGVGVFVGVFVGAAGVFVGVAVVVGVVGVAVGVTGVAVGVGVVPGLQFAQGGSKVCNRFTKVTTSGLPAGPGV